MYLQEHWIVALNKEHSENYQNRMYDGLAIGIYIYIGSPTKEYNPTKSGT